MLVEFVTADNHPKLVEWWTAQGWPPVPMAALPKTGLIVDDCCAGFLYRTDSTFALIEFIIANPKVENERRSKALDTLIEVLTKTAKEAGFVQLFTSTNHQNLIKRYTKHNYVVTDKNVTNLIRIL